MYKILDIDGTTCLLKQDRSDEMYGFKNLAELNLLCSFEHPNILGAKELFVKDATVVSVLPLATLGLDSMIQKYSSEERLKVLFRVADALRYLVKNDIFLSKLTLAFKGNSVYVVSLKEQNGNWESLSNSYKDLFLKIMSDPRCPSSEPFKYVNKLYKELCGNFFVSSFASPEEVVSHPVFDAVREIVPSGKKVVPIQEPSLEHRDILKLILFWTKELCPHLDVKVLFLSLDLFSKVTPLFTTSLERMSGAVTCIWLSAKLQSYSLTAEQVTSVCSRLVPGITVKMLLENELKILDFLQGVLDSCVLYDKAQTLEDLKFVLSEVFLNKDMNTYKNFQIEHFKSQQGSSKHVLVKDF